MPRNAGSGAHESTRQLLIQAGKRLFAEHGYAAATVRDIARAADVNLSLVSYHFKGKEGLYRAVIDQFGTERLASAASMLRPARTRAEFRERLRMAIDEVLRVQIDDPDVCLILHREIESGIPIAARVFERTFLKVFAAWVEFFESAKKARLIAPRVDSLAMAQVVNCITAHLFRVDGLRHRYFKQSLRDLSHRRFMVDQVTDVLLSGAFAEGDR